MSWPMMPNQTSTRLSQIQTHDVGDLRDQLRVGGEFERLGAPGLHAVVAPGPRYRRVADLQWLTSSREDQCVMPSFFGGVNVAVMIAS